MKLSTTHATVAQTLDNQSPVQAALDHMQTAQEQAVNAGHRPDRAIRFILRIEDERRSVLEAERRLMRAIYHAEQQCVDADDELHERI